MCPRWFPRGLLPTILYYSDKQYLKKNTDKEAEARCLEKMAGKGLGRHFVYQSLVFEGVFYIG